MSIVIIGTKKSNFGEWNIELSLSVHNHKEFIHFITEIERLFGDDSQAYEVLVYTHKFIDEGIPAGILDTL
jgi:hypothetical protein